MTAEAPFRVRGSAEQHLAEGRHLSTVVPIGRAVTVPAQAITGWLDAFGLAGILVATVGACWLASWFWRLGLRNYTGASA